MNKKKRSTKHDQFIYKAALDLEKNMILNQEMDEWGSTTADTLKPTNHARADWKDAFSNKVGKKCDGYCDGYIEMPFTDWEKEEWEW